MYYVRKLSNVPNLEKIRNSDNVGDLAADIVKQELGTTGNTLSFWKCDDLDNLCDTIKAILLSTTGIKTAQFFIVSDSVIEKYGFIMDDSQPGSTGYKGFEKLHTNMIELTYSKLGLILQMLQEVFKDPENTPKLDKGKVKSYIREVKKAGLLNDNALQEQLKKEIDRYCQT